MTAIQSNVRKNIFCKNVYYDIVAHVPNFATSSSLSSAFFLHYDYSFFLTTPYVNKSDRVKTAGNKLVLQVISIQSQAQINGANLV